MRRALELCLLSAGLLCATGADADTLSIADIFGPVAVPSLATPLVTLTQFDPALGTLTKVTITLDANTSGGTIAWDNEALVATDITLGIGAEVTATGPGGLTAVAVPLQTGSAVGIDADNDGAADFLGTDAFAVVGGTGSDSDTGMLSAGLAPYIGLGSVDISISSTVETYLSTTGGFGPIDPVPGMFDGIVTLAYEFTPIPEPTTALLLASGLGALALARRMGDSSGLRSRPDTLPLD